MSAAEAVLFDLYDTLVTGDWRRHTSMAAAILGVSEGTVRDAYELLRERRDSGRFPDAHTTLAAVAEACGVAAGDDLIAELVGEEARFLAEQVQWYGDSVAVLRRLRAEGYKTAVVSNCSPSTRPLVARLALRSETDAVVLSCDVGVSKPDPGIFHAALDHLGTEPSRAVFVDDRGDYLDGARHLGMRTFQIARPLGFGESVPEGDHPTITTLEELVPLLADGT